MDYKEKYEMALEGIQEILGSGEDSIKMSRLQLRLQGIFPELKECKESDDERIRKVLVELVKCNERCGYFMINNITTSAMLAWLEKQCQTFTKKDIDEAYLKGICDAKHELEKQGEQKPWSKEDERDFDVIRGIIYNSCNAEDASRLLTWLLSLRPKKQWKPSLAQLNALSIVSKGNAPDDIEAIVSLYNDLKKLKG